jgi:hypothetical protein
MPQAAATQAGHLVTQIGRDSVGHLLLGVPAGVIGNYPILFATRVPVRCSYCTWEAHLYLEDAKRLVEEHQRSHPKRKRWRVSSVDNEMVIW